MVPALPKNWGAVVRLAGRNAEAQTELRMALEIQQEVLGRDHPELARTLHNLADSLLLDERVDEADAHLERALIIKERAYGKEHVHVADTLAVIGVLHVTRHEYDLADQKLGRALAIWEQNPPEDPVHHAEALANLALALQTQGRTDEASALYEQAAPVFERELGPGHPSTMRLRYSGAASYSVQGNYSVAMHRYEEMLKQAEASMAADDVRLAKPLMGLATAEL